MSGGELVPIVAKNAAKSAEQLGQSIGGTLSDVWQTVVGDKVAAWRLKNAAIQDKELRAELEARNVKINLSTIPPRYAFAWFEKISEEDEPDIQRLFAKLLANAAEGNEDALNRRNIKLIGELTPASAALFSEITSHLGRESKQWGMVRQDFRLDDVEPVEEVIRGKLKRHLEYEVLMSLTLIQVRHEIAVSDRAHYGFGTIFSTVAAETFSEKGVSVKEGFRLTETGLSLARALASPANESSSVRQSD